MYRAFQTAITIHKPDIVFILGKKACEYNKFCSERSFSVLSLIYPEIQAIYPEIQAICPEIESAP